MIKKTTMTVAALALVVGGGVFAADNTDLTQTINAGVLSTTILDENRADVTNPSVAMTALSASFDCETTTGSLGSNTERVYAANPDASDTGFVVSLAATGGTTDTWTDGGTNEYDFNDATTAGCDDGADSDNFAGQLSVDPSVATLTTDYSGSSTTGITQGSSSAFDEGTTDSITLLNAGATSDDVWRGYLTGIDLSQTVPAEQPATSYDINLTLDVVAQ